MKRSEPLIKFINDDEPTRKENFLLSVRSEREQAQSSDQAKIKPRLLDLIEERSMVRRHCGDQRGN